MKIRFRYIFLKRFTVKGRLNSILSLTFSRTYSSDVISSFRSKLWILTKASCQHHLRCRWESFIMNTQIESGITLSSLDKSEHLVALLIVILVFHQHTSAENMQDFVLSSILKLNSGLSILELSS